MQLNGKQRFRGNRVRPGKVQNKTYLFFIFKH